MPYNPLWQKSKGRKMADKTKLSRAGKITAVLGLLLAGTGTGYLLGAGQDDPFDQLTEAFQSAAEAESAEKKQDALDAAFAQETCDKIDESLDSIFRAAGADNDFTATMQQRNNGSPDVCRIYLRGEEVFAFFEPEHFSTENYAHERYIQLFVEKSIDGLSQEQLTKLQKTMPALIRDLSP